MNVDEIWAPIDGTKGYEISNYGRVRRAMRGFYNRGRHKYLKGYNNHGYIRHEMGKPGGGVIIGFAHRMVLIAFEGPPPTDKHEACHWDGDTLNNHISNLRWGVRKENKADSIRHGTQVRGTRHADAKLTDAIVTEMRLRNASGVSIEQLGREYGVRSNAAWCAVKGRTWTHVPMPRAA